MGVSRKGGRFLLSDSEIRRYAEAKIDAEEIRVNELANKAILKDIINNSKITPLSNGSYGITYKLQLNADKISPFVKISDDELSRIDSPGATCTKTNFYQEPCLVPVRTFLLKMSFIDNVNKVFKTASDVPDLNSLSEAEFTREAKAQDEIYVNTFDIANPLVPACLSTALIFNKEGVNTEIKNLKLAGGVLPTIDMMGVDKIGFILMEFAEGYETLWSIWQSTSQTEKKNKAFALYKTGHFLLYQAGYMHGDHHFGNAMIDLNNNKVLIIDYGRAVHMRGQLPIELGNYDIISNQIKAYANRFFISEKEGYNKIADPDLSKTTNKQVEQLISNRIEKKKNLLKKLSTHQDNQSIIEFTSTPTFSNFNRLRYNLPPLAQVTVQPKVAVPLKATVPPKAEPPLPVNKAKVPGSTPNQQAYKEKLEVQINNWLSKSQLSDKLSLTDFNKYKDTKLVKPHFTKITTRQAVIDVDIYVVSALSKEKHVGTKLDSLLRELQPIPVGAPAPKRAGKRKTRRRRS